MDKVLDLWNDRNNKWDEESAKEAMDIWRNALPSNVSALANAIIQCAVDDYWELGIQGRIKGDPRETRSGILAFFSSEWGDSLCSALGFDAKRARMALVERTEEQDEINRDAFIKRMEAILSR